MHIYKRHAPTRGSGSSAHSSIYDGLGSNAKEVIEASFILTTLGQFFLVFLCATLLLFRGPYKHKAALVNMVVVTLLSTIPPYLLYVSHLLVFRPALMTYIYRVYGRAIYEEPPPVGLCVIQAASMSGVGTMSDSIHT